MKKLIFGVRYLRHFLFSGFYSLGSRVIFEKNVTVNNACYMQLGRNVILEVNSLLSVIDHPEYNREKPRLIIEDNVGIGYGSIILALNKVHIEKHVMIGPYVTIVDYDHNYKDVKKSINDQGLNSKPVVTSEGSWIGTKATICKGVKIGRNSVVGANSLVTKDIPDYSVVAGAPANVIKKYNPETKNWERVTEDEK